MTHVAQFRAQTAAAASRAAIARSKATVASGAAFIASPLRKVVTKALEGARAANVAQRTPLVSKSTTRTPRDIVSKAREDARAGAAQQAAARGTQTAEPQVSRKPTHAEILERSGLHGYPGTVPTVSGFMAARRAIRDGELPA